MLNAVVAHVLQRNTQDFAEADTIASTVTNTTAAQKRAAVELLQYVDISIPHPALQSVSAALESHLKTSRGGTSVQQPSALQSLGALCQFVNGKRMSTSGASPQVLPCTDPSGGGPPSPAEVARCVCRILDTDGARTWMDTILATLLRAWLVPGQLQEAIWTACPTCAASTNQAAAVNVSGVPIALSHLPRSRQREHANRRAGKRKTASGRSDTPRVGTAGGRGGIMSSTLRSRVGNSCAIANGYQNFSIVLNSIDVNSDSIADALVIWLVSLLQPAADPGSTASGTSRARARLRAFACVVCVAECLHSDGHISLADRDALNDKLGQVVASTQARVCSRLPAPGAEAARPLRHEQLVAALACCWLNECGQLLSPRSNEGTLFPESLAVSADPEPLHAAGSEASLVTTHGESINQHAGHLAHRLLQMQCRTAFKSTRRGNSNDEPSALSESTADIVASICQLPSATRIALGPALVHSLILESASRPFAAAADGVCVLSILLEAEVITVDRLQHGLQAVFRTVTTTNPTDANSERASLRTKTLSWLTAGLLNMTRRDMVSTSWLKKIRAQYSCSSVIGQPASPDSIIRERPGAEPPAPQQLVAVIDRVLQSLRSEDAVGQKAQQLRALGRWH